MSKRAKIRVNVSIVSNDDKMTKRVNSVLISKNDSGDLVLHEPVEFREDEHAVIHADI